jgi:hypothetical protein
MTEDRQALIDKFQSWLDTEPNKKIIAAECATIAQKYAEQLLIQRVSQQRELLEAYTKQVKEDNELTEEITFQDINKCLASNCG